MTLITLPYLVRMLGAEAYGVVGMAAVLVGQLAWLQIGLGPATTRLVAAALGRGGKQEARATLRASAFIGILTGTGAALCFVAASHWFWLRRLAGSPLLTDAVAAIPAGAVMAAAQSVAASGQGTLLGEQRYGVLALLRTAQGSGRMVAAAMAVRGGLGLTGLLVAQAAVDVAAALVGLWLASAFVRGQASRTDAVTKARELLGLGLPFAVTGGIQGLLADAEKIAVAIARPVADFAYYSVPQGAAVRLGGITAGYAGILVPRLAFLGGAGDSLAVASLMRRTARVAVGFVGGWLCIVIAATPELLRFWLGADFAALSTTATRLLLLVVLVSTAGSTYNAALRALARPSVLAIVHGVQLPAHVALLYILVRTAGVSGAAFALFLRSLLDLACHAYAARRTLGTPLDGAVDALRALAPASALVALCEGFPGLPAVVRIGAGALVGLALAGRFVGPEDRRALVRALLPLPRG